jgi:hypothetical protein
LIAGRTISEGGDVKGLHIIGNAIWEDAWIVKLNSDLKLEWQRCLGGGKNEIGYLAFENPQGNITVLAVTESLNGDVEASSLGSLGRTLWWVEMDNLGQILKQKVYPQVACNAVIAASAYGNGKIVLSAHVEQTFEFWNVYRYYRDFLSRNFPETVLVNLDESGNVLWERQELQSLDLSLVRIVADITPGFVVAANRIEPDDQKEIWIMKLDVFGKVTSDVFLGGKDDDGVFYILPQGDASYLITGFTEAKTDIMNESHSVYVHRVTFP